MKRENEIFYTITLKIKNRKKDNKPLVIGINGIDASGKTTFTYNLNNYLIENGFKTQIINIDDFHNTSNIRYKDNDPVMSYINNAFNLIRLENELLIPISKSIIINKELALLNLEDDKYTNYKIYNVDNDTIVLLEGVLLFREPIDKYLDIRIYLDITFDEVLKRVKVRDYKTFGNEVIDKYNNKYIPIQKYYIKKYNPIKKSDLVINNNDYLNPIIYKKKS